MRKSEIKVGGRYIVNTEAGSTVAELLRPHFAKGWMAKNLRTGQEIHIGGLQRLRREATPEEVQDMARFGHTLEAA